MRKLPVGAVATWFARACLVAAISYWSATPTWAQQPDEPPAHPAEFAAAVKELEALVAEADTLVKKGDLAGARIACQRALASAKLEGASPEWLAAVEGALWDLSTTARRAHDPSTEHDAEAAILEHRSRTLPDEHRGLQGARWNLAATKSILGDLPGALALFEKILAVCSKILPDEHPELQRARQCVAETKEALGDPAGALALREKVVAVWSESLPDDHPDLQAARENLAWTKQALGDLTGALALQEKVFAVRSKSLPDDHPDLQRARESLALTRKRLGDLPGALALQEKILEVRSKSLPDDHPDLQTAREVLARTKKALGDLQGALALQEKVFAVRSKTLADDHPDLQAARGSLANTKFSLGDLQGALALEEEIFDVYSRTLPDDHPRVLTARGNLAATKMALGDLRGALDLLEKVFAVRSKTLPDDHPLLQLTRQNLAATKRQLGDLPGALVLEEKVLAILSKSLPDDHPYLQTARGNLAVTKKALGDLPGALALEEKVFEVRSKSLPDDHPDLQTARQNLANTKSALGDLPGALALDEEVFAISSKTLPDDHPDLQRARQCLAGTKYDLGDLQAALTLYEKVLAVRSRSLPDDHIDVQAARQNLAATKKELGDLAGALALQETVLEVRAKSLPDDHPDLQSARQSLANTTRALGDLPGAAQLYNAAAASAITRVSRSPASIRDVAELAVAATKPLSLGGSLLDEIAATGEDRALPPQLEASLAKHSLALLTAIRSAQAHTTRLLREARERNTDEFEPHVQAIAIASKALDDAIGLPPEGRTDAAGHRIGRDDAIRQAVLARDTAERALLESVPEELRAVPTAEALANGLETGEAAVAFLTYAHRTNDAEKPWVTTSEQRFAAFVLTKSGDVTWHSLAPSAEVENLIANVRRLALDGTRSGGRETGSKLGARFTELRRLLVDPLLGSLPDGTESLVVSLADELQLVPIDDLPMADGRTFGETFHVQIVPSLRTLLLGPAESTKEPTALTLGSVDYDSKPDAPAPVFAATSTPIVADASSTDRGAGDQPGGSATPKAFADLFNTEAQRVGKMFERTFEDATPTVLREGAASEAAFVAQAPGKTYLHLATHGYFAPTSAWRATDDAEDGSALARFDAAQDRVSRLSPFSLTGLALAGANLPPDELGRREGILTAEEIAQLDLSSCYLTTLSACNTSLGVRRGGTGLASLRQAFHAAGVRFVLATLWEVNDVYAE
ncbi:MAG: CHAT domain-containing protein, partial [Planctomycetes bacterium]|nr:CHAT domain-containing protein [Planctomycetota bacterium]